MTKAILTAQRTSSNEQTKATNIAVFASSMAHELQNYLQAINICAEISETRMQDILHKIKDAAYLITNLQLQIRGLVEDTPNIHNFKPYSMTENINYALANYPFRSQERELVQVIGKDFAYIGDPVLTNHLLYNLLKNALRAIQDADKGDIVIKLKPGKKFNQLIFIDTASGVSKNFLPKIFELAASQTSAQGGMGVGLAYCKAIMQTYGGAISCVSKEKQYTEFKLSFPVKTTNPSKRLLVYGNK